MRRRGDIRELQSDGDRAGTPAPPGRCYLCGSGEVVLRFPARGQPAAGDSRSYRCTSFGHRRHAPIWRCPSCGMLSQWPVPDQGELVEAYRAVEDPLYEAERDNRYFTFRRVLKELGPAEGRSLLDVGAYCGYFLDVAREGGFRGEGIELSEWAATRARQLGLTVHSETLQERAASGARYDVVTMWDVVEHLADPREELRHAVRLLRPGGRLHLSTVDAGSLVARAMGRHWPWLMDMHLHYFTRPTLGRLLAEVGLVEVTYGYYTHVVSAGYLLSKLGAIAPPAAPVFGFLARAVPRDWRVAVNLGDNMLVSATRPA